MAAYQANYGFNQGEDSEANNTAVSSSDPAPPESNNKAPEKETSGDVPPKPVPEQQETSAKGAKQKGEKRKSEPGKLMPTNKHNTNLHLVACTFHKLCS